MKASILQLQSTFTVINFILPFCVILNRSIKIGLQFLSSFFRGCDTSCQRECLAAHNRYRLNHGASPLLLDQKLADQAQRWADKKVFKHSPWAGGQGGETIALGSLYPTFTAAVKAWHDEERDYDWSTGTGNGDMKVNHFTQVWLKTYFYVRIILVLEYSMQSLSLACK